jgi:PAS domain S-box-containing protein
MLERLQEDGYVRYQDLPLEKKDGGHVDVEFVSNVYQSGDTQVIQCNIRDITQRKEADAARIQLSAIIESSEDAIVSEDLNTNVTSWNAAAERIFGFTAAEMIGTSVMRVIPLDRQTEEVEILRRIQRGLRQEHFETVRVAKDGHLINASVTVSPIRDSIGCIVGASKIVRDITERKAREDALRRSEARYQRVAANVPGMVYQFLLRPNGTFAFPFASEGCHEICGLDPEQLQQDGSLGVDMIHSDDRPGYDQSIMASASSLLPWNWEGRLARKDNGETRYIQAAARPERQENGDVIWDGVMMDVTDRKQAEEHRLAKDVAVLASADKS